jgi:hypothetical protein
VLFPDSSFINTALVSADKARKKIGSSVKLFVNDYNGLSATASLVTVLLMYLSAQCTPILDLHVLSSNLTIKRRQFPLSGEN